MEQKDLDFGVQQVDLAAEAMWYGNDHSPMSYSVDRDQWQGVELTVTQ